MKKKNVLEQKLFIEFKNYVLHNIKIPISLAMLEKFHKYLNGIKLWNKKINLISFNDDEEILYRHFYDSLYSVKIINKLYNKTFINKKMKIIDIGTGVGMPGIPVKIVLPKIQLALVESIRKKCKFLEYIKKVLFLNVKVFNDRAEKLAHTFIYRQKYDFVLSRGVAKFSINLEITVPFLKVGGRLIIYKTKTAIKDQKHGLYSVKNAIKQLNLKLERILYYKLPKHKLKYCILVFKKTRKNTLRFPRKIEIQNKYPL
ncbi:MAG: 16S rRNA (guanine(527)-N(7))-methyltransferase RsmG [Endomicrobium sp.]|jgi:16S rRNA (guanine527-N7)-methyltransferase|nr:16S rRNA (guanine(527)-N(7))-methyltransferase RsmG [Endomicrobium sp.]